MLAIISQPLVNMASGEPVIPLHIYNERLSISQGIKSAGLNVQLYYVCEATPNAIANTLQSDWNILLL